MKKFLSIALICAVAVVCFAACGGNEKAPEATQTAAEAIPVATEEAKKSVEPTVELGKFTVVENDTYSDTELIVTVTNNDDEAKAYEIKIDAFSEDGTVIESDTVTTPKIEAGQKSEVVAFALVDKKNVEALKTADYSVASVVEK